MWSLKNNVQRLGSVLHTYLRTLRKQQSMHAVDCTYKREDAAVGKNSTEKKESKRKRRHKEFEEKQ